jgi:hypothetical protein
MYALTKHIYICTRGTAGPDTNTCSPGTLNSKTFSAKAALLVLGGNICVDADTFQHACTEDIVSRTSLACMMEVLVESSRLLKVCQNCCLKQVGWAESATFAAMLAVYCVWQSDITSPGVNILFDGEKVEYALESNPAGGLKAVGVTLLHERKRDPSVRHKGVLKA